MPKAKASAAKAASQSSALPKSSKSAISSSMDVAPKLSGRDKVRQHELHPMGLDQDVLDDIAVHETAELDEIEISELPTSDTTTSLSGGRFDEVDAPDANAHAPLTRTASARTVGDGSSAGRLQTAKPLQRMESSPTFPPRAGGTTSGSSYSALRSHGGSHDVGKGLYLDNAAKPPPRSSATAQLQRRTQPLLAEPPVSQRDPSALSRAPPQSPARVRPQPQLAIAGRIAKASSASVGRGRGSNSARDAPNRLMKVGTTSTTISASTASGYAVSGSIGSEPESKSLASEGMAHEPTPEDQARRIARLEAENARLLRISQLLEEQVREKSDLGPQVASQPGDELDDESAYSLA